MKKLRKRTFEDYKLRGMLYIKYNDSPYNAITSAYPEKNYKPWNFVNTPNNYWQGIEGKKNATEAIKWLFEDKLKWSMKDIKKILINKYLQKIIFWGCLKEHLIVIYMKL